MGSLGRKLSRDKAKEAMKRLQKKTRQTMMLFDRLPETCTNCGAPFDRKNKEDVSTWTTVVRQGTSLVHLYCPPCWDSANEMIKEIKEKVAPVD